MGLESCPLGLDYGIQIGEVNDGQVMNIFADHFKKYRRKEYFIPRKVKLH